MRRRALIMVPAILPAALAGCSSPPFDLYTLAAIAGTPVRTGPRSIELRRIGLAGYLDRPEIVREAADFRLLVTDRDRWGEPLGRMIERVLTENLVQRLPDAAVFAETGAISTQPDTILEIDIQRFDGDAAGNVVLLAQMAIRHDGTRRPASARTVRITRTLAGPGTTHLVGAMSAALAQLADDVAGSIGGGRPGSGGKAGAGKL